MKIIVIHGDDITKLYERFTKFTEEAKKRNWEVTDYSLSEVSNQTLFDTEKFFILKDYKKLTKKEIESLEKYSGNLVIYNEGKIPAPMLKTLKPAKIEIFELPQLLWKFLDNFDIKIFHELIKTQAAEFVLAMMAWKLKQKYTKDKSKEVGKMITDLAEIDANVKIGKANLVQSLDLLLIKHLK